MPKAKHRTPQPPLTAVEATTKAVKKGTMYTLYETRRIFIPLVLLIIGTFMLDKYGAQLGNWALRLHKINQVTFYVILAHLVRSQIFYYMDLGDLYERKDPAFAPFFIGVCILMAAIILGGTLGL